MTRVLKVIRCSPGASVQDLGRPGFLRFGLSRGGAVDRLAVFEGAALLAQSATLAVIEMPGSGGEFEATEDMRVALTGAAMRAQIDGETRAWNASHALRRGARLSIGGATSGNYGYLSVGGGFDTPVTLGSRAAHLAFGIGGTISSGDKFPVGVDKEGNKSGFCIEPNERTAGGSVRIVATPQTGLFSNEELARFEDTRLLRDVHSNRMGVRLLSDNEGFASEAGLSVLSDTIVPGDIQVTGDGTPLVLLSECQTTGGYPRIGTVLPCDLPRVVQAGTNAALRFVFVTMEEAVQAEAMERVRWARLRDQVKPLVRRPEDIRDMLSYQLISGVTAGDDLERSEA